METKFSARETMDLYAQTKVALLRMLVSCSRQGVERLPSEEDLGKLWTKFYKVDKARTRAYGGSGIGLSIVKAIMDSHNKACGVQNVKDGVEFWFTLDCSV